MQVKTKQVTTSVYVLEFSAGEFQRLHTILANTTANGLIAAGGHPEAALKLEGFAREASAQMSNFEKRQA